MPPQLSSRQTKYLRGLAHRLKPLVLVGKNGVTPDVVAAVDAALEKHELIKVKFLETRDKDQKDDMVAVICRETGAHQAGAIGHTAILYRQAAKASRRRIVLPKNPPA